MWCPQPNFFCSQFINFLLKVWSKSAFYYCALLLILYVYYCIVLPAFYDQWWCSFVGYVCLGGYNSVFLCVVYGCASRLKYFPMFIFVSYSLSLLLSCNQDNSVLDLKMIYTNIRLFLASNFFKYQCTLFGLLFWSSCHLYIKVLMCNL